MVLVNVAKHHSDWRHLFRILDRRWHSSKICDSCIRLSWLSTNSRGYMWSSESWNYHWRSRVTNWSANYYSYLLYYAVRIVQKLMTMIITHFYPHFLKFCGISHKCRWSSWMSLKITRIDDIRSVSSTVADPSLGFTTMNLHFRDFCTLTESHAGFRKSEIVVDIWGSRVGVRTSIPYPSCKLPLLKMFKIQKVATQSIEVELKSG